MPTIKIFLKDFMNLHPELVNHPFLYITLPNLKKSPRFGVSNGLACGQSCSLPYCGEFRGATEVIVIAGTGMERTTIAFITNDFTTLSSVTVKWVIISWPLEIDISSSKAIVSFTDREDFIPIAMATGLEGVDYLYQALVCTMKQAGNGEPESAQSLPSANGLPSLGGRALQPGLHEVLGWR